VTGSDRLKDHPTFTQALADTLSATVGQATVPVDTPIDTGWVNIALTPPFVAQSASEVPQVRRIGIMTYARGGWSSTGMSASANFNVGTVPAGFWPKGRNALFRYATSGGGTSGGGLVQTSDGTVQVRTGGTLASYYFFPAGLFWFMDS